SSLHRDYTAKLLIRFTLERQTSVSPTVLRMEKGQAHITGSEAVKDWENVEGTVWKAVIPNRIFGDYNPFTTLVSGDWFIATFIAHTGDVYLNEKSMCGATALDKVKNPQKSTISWDPDFSVYTWFAEPGEANNQTIIYANFQ
ncbi:MAG: hypothetical protein V8Q87_10965, partial [Blautia wexlerae]